MADRGRGELDWYSTVYNCESNETDMMRTLTLQLSCLLARLLTLCLLFAAAAMSGCAALVVAGAGGGAYSYIAGNLVREYHAEHSDTVQASLTALKQLKFKLVQESGDGIDTTIEGMRADETPVTIHVERLGHNRTRVGIRTGSVGYMNRSVSEQVHEYILSELNRKPAKKKNRTGKDSSRAKMTISPAAEKKIIEAEPAAEKEKGQDDALKPDQQAPRNTVYLYFHKQENSVPKRLYPQLDKVAEYLLKESAIRVDIRGYTDSTGLAKNNLLLSQQRVDSVKAYLLGKGVERSRVAAQGYGATEFIESNAKESLRAMNRRVELHFK